MNCLFCKIIRKENPADIIFENAETIIFKDINPKARIHLLITPKKHIPSIKEVEDVDRELLGSLILLARDMAKKENLRGYKLLFNVGQEGGQIIDHVHLHLTGN
ncbi:HIT domain-containing protein [Patescibacteria group bacterium]|nr:HIT domain-containing protein [Patescibacteria group bacterium]